MKLHIYYQKGLIIDTQTLTQTRPVIQMNQVRTSFVVPSAPIAAEDFIPEFLLHRYGLLLSRSATNCAIFDAAVKYDERPLDET